MDIQTIVEDLNFSLSAKDRLEKLEITVIDLRMELHSLSMDLVNMRSRLEALTQMIE